MVASHEERLLRLRDILYWAKTNINLKDSDDVILESIVIYSKSTYGVLRVSARDYANTILHLLKHPEIQTKWVTELHTHKRRRRSAKKMVKREKLVQTKEDDPNNPEVLRVKAVERNFAIAYASSGRRQEYALYRLWRYLDVPKRIIVQNMRQNSDSNMVVKDLDNLFGTIFTEKCLSSDDCTLKPFLGEMKDRPTCTWKGCNEPVIWSLKHNTWSQFCSVEHGKYYWGYLAALKRYGSIVQKTLQLLQYIVQNNIEYQSELQPYFQGVNQHELIRTVSRWMIRFEKYGWIERTRVFYKKRYTLKIKVTERGLEVLRNSELAS